MRELVTIDFQDNSLYTPQQGADMAAIAIAHFWGPVGAIKRVTAATIDTFYPKTILSQSYLKAYMMLKYGIPTVEIVRAQGTAEYLYVDDAHIGITPFPLSQSATVVELAGDYILHAKYPGFHPKVMDCLNAGRKLKVKITFNDITASVNVDGRSITIETIDVTTDPTTLEKIEGSPTPGHATDGQFDFITDLMVSKSEYWHVQFDEAFIATDFGTGGPADLQFETALADVDGLPWAETDTTEQNLIDIYEKILISTDYSDATIVVASYSSEDLNKAVLALAEARSNCVGIVGYPLSETFAQADMETFVALMTPTKFGITCFARAVENFLGRKVIHDGVGPAAGRYAIVRKDAGPNQIPSALTYGAYPATLTDSLTFAEVLDLHDNFSVNSIYSAPVGAQMFGIRTLHTRKASYFALSNVMRIVSLLLKSTLVTADAVIHTSNNPTKRAMIQLDRQSYLDQLIGIENLKPQSVCICNGDNNTDAATEGGKWLVIDFDLWFYKLIERVHINIKASDTTTQITIG